MLKDSMFDFLSFTAHLITGNFQLADLILGAIVRQRLSCTAALHLLFLLLLLRLQAVVFVILMASGQQMTSKSLVINNPRDSSLPHMNPSASLKLYRVRPRFNSALPDCQVSLACWHQ